MGILTFILNVILDAKGLPVDQQAAWSPCTIGERARPRGCAILQLTSEMSRQEAIRFYENLGFVASHEGMKLNLLATNRFGAIP